MRSKTGWMNGDRVDLDQTPPSPVSDLGLHFLIGHYHIYLIFGYLNLGVFVLKSEPVHFTIFYVSTE